MGETFFGADREVSDASIDLQASRSEAESKRFGIPVYRLTLSHSASLTSDLRRALVAIPNSALLLLNLVDCDIDGIQDIEQEFGRPMVICTPSVDWEWTGQHHQTSAWEVSTSHALEHLENSMALAQIPCLVEASFFDYRNHHWEDALLRPHLDLGVSYAEWAVNELMAGGADAYVLRLDSEAGCFLVDQGMPGGGRRILLAATLPSFRNRGCYTEMLKKYLLAKFVEGHGRVRITTQVSNVRVQRRWASLGFRPESLIRHVHIWPVGIDSSTTPRIA